MSVCYFITHIYKTVTFRLRKMRPKKNVSLLRFLHTRNRVTVLDVTECNILRCGDVPV